jgi:hypothetical protein
MMHPEEAAAKMDLVVLVAEKVGFLSFKIRQGNWLQTMAEMVDTVVVVAVAQAAAAILCMLLGLEEATPEVGQEVLPITMVEGAAAPTTPVPTPPPLEGFKAATGKLLLLGRELGANRLMSLCPTKLRWRKGFGPSNHVFIQPHPL